MSWVASGPSVALLKRYELFSARLDPPWALLRPPGMLLKSFGAFLPLWTLLGRLWDLPTRFRGSLGPLVLIELSAGAGSNFGSR